MGLFALLYASFFFCQTALEARLQKKGVRWEYPGLKSITGKGTPHFFFSRGAGSPFRIYKAFKVLEGIYIVNSHLFPPEDGIHIIFKVWKALRKSFKFYVLVFIFIFAITFVIPGILKLWRDWGRF